MKTLAYMVGFFSFSALMLSPKMPKKYPPREIIEQRNEIDYKEIKIKKLIEKIETQIEKDSVEITLNK